MKRNKILGLVAIIIVFGIIVILVVLNAWIGGEVVDLQGFRLTHQSLPQSSSDNILVVKKQNNCLTGHLIRKSQLHPNREFTENIIFCDTEEIARFNSQEEKIYDMEGEIPDGVIKFFDESKKLHGEENFWRGKRHGEYKEFYETGEVRRNAQYFYGKMMSNKVYFIDGTLRMEQDFSDALDIANEPEVGVGKIYYRQGGLMYEWNLTRQLKGGYKKSYNVDGKLAEEKRYNELGELIETIRPNINDRL